MWKCWQLFLRKPILHALRLRPPLKLFRTSLWKEWNVFRNLCTVLTPVTVSLWHSGSDVQGNLPFSWIIGALSIRLQSPTNCAKKLSLDVSTALQKGRSSPAPSQAVTGKGIAGVDLPNGCQSWQGGQRQSPNCLWWCDLSSWVPSYCSAPMTQI